ncbi:MAG: response regulator [Bacteroidetes bacterium]|jgi:signal transduction histidine kinase|nr:response regulator [Bacteroidota bacterium]
MITNSVEQSVRKDSTAERKSPLKVLLVDDIPANLLTLESILEDENRILIKAFSGNEALKLLMEEPIDLILLDIQMPDMDGIEVAQLLRANPKTKHIPIIFVSAIAKSERPSFAEFEAGSYDFIPKPLDIEETQKMVAIFESGCRYKSLIKEQDQKIKRLTEHFDKFLYILSHDLNAPLRAIDNLVQWLEEDLKSSASEESLENINLLRNRVGKMKLLLDGLLKFARAGSKNTQPEMVNPRTLAEDIFRRVNNKIETTLNIESEIESFETDKSSLSIVLNELMQNAIQHNTNPYPEINVKITKSQSKVEFSISDNGQGIKPQQQKMIFEIFQTLPNSHNEESAGVGLAIVKKLVEDRGGVVWVSPTSKAGLDIHFTWK